MTSMILYLLLAGVEPHDLYDLILSLMILEYLRVSCVPIKWLVFSLFNQGSIKLTGSQSRIVARSG